MWLYLWDDDDDDEDEDEEEDNTDPYGEDEDPNEDDSMNDEGEDEGMDAGEDEGEGEGEAEAEVEEEEEKKKKEDDKDDKGGKGKFNKKKSDALAKAYDFLKLPPGLDQVLRCPDCKQASLYMDKVTSTGKRIIIAIVKGVIGCDNMDKDLNVLRFVCLNKGCKQYWKRTGTKYKVDTTSGVKLVKEVHPFHADI